MDDEQFADPDEITEAHACCPVWEVNNESE